MQGLESFEFLAVGGDAFGGGLDLALRGDDFGFGGDGEVVFRAVTDTFLDIDAFTHPFDAAAEFLRRCRAGGCGRAGVGRGMGLRTP